MPQPSVGRQVHFVSTEPGDDRAPVSVCRAATITKVGGLVSGQRYPGVEVASDNEVVSLAVFDPGGLIFAQGVLHDDGEDHSREQFPRPNRDPIVGSWHWPERVD